MAAVYNPKTLAKTISYLLVHAPGEHGLYWDEDGAMPWKELYWAMQEDPSLRFVREAHLREIIFLGLEFPAVLDGNRLKLKSTQPFPDYPVVDAPPARLYTTCRGKSLLYAREHGLAAAGRPFLAVTSDRDLALRMGRWRDSDPILIEVLSAEALSEGIVFRSAGGALFLVERVPVRALRFPHMSEERLQSLAAQHRKEKSALRPGVSRTPGSFTLGVEHLQEAFGIPQQKGEGPPKGKGRKGAEWKRASRKERTKRNV